MGVIRIGSVMERVLGLRRWGFGLEGESWEMELRDKWLEWMELLEGGFGFSI